VPTYQYACTECGHEFETVQSFADASLTECPACTGKLRKVFNAVGIVFKGSGFYRTDSRSGSSTAAADGGSDGEAKTGEAKKDDAKKDGTPANAGGGSSASGSTPSGGSGSTPSAGSSTAKPTSSSTAGSAA
jgi:putative FmdB family regulatory protein